MIIVNGPVPFLLASPCFKLALLLIHLPLPDSTCSTSIELLHPVKFFLRLFFPFPI